ncbi:MAG: hypothetical protein HQM01_08250 [Magnetococcales bacterium]|nr:hypothetical protein [Magnetococcales bacterium]
MTTPVDICNRALSLIGGRATIATFAEPGVEALQCRLHYEATRQSLLRRHPWGFARAQVALAELGNPPAPWRHQYAMPGRCLRLRFVMSAAAPVCPGMAVPSGGGFGNYQIGTTAGTDPHPVTVILTDIPNAMAVYTADIEDPGLWDAGFTTAMVHALAAAICQGITGDKGLSQALTQMAQLTVNTAMASSANESPSIRPTHTPDWIAARNGYGDITPLEAS